MSEPTHRRPLKTRSAGWARGLGAWLAARGASPNGISAVGLLVAAGGLLAFLASARPGAARAAWLVLAAACIQARLLCNLLDGLVAVEGGRKTPTGELWNEVPDRVEDTLFLVGAGLASGHAWGLPLGLGAALAAMLTAYVRALGGSLGFPQDFRGPMAKPHRMALLTAACLLATAEPRLGWPPVILASALGLILAGALVTALRRLRGLAQQLRSRP
jgi:phosphatidylglycerophosphate synthase